MPYMIGYKCGSKRCVADDLRDKARSRDAGNALSRRAPRRARNAGSAPSSSRDASSRCGRKRPRARTPLLQADGGQSDDEEATGLVLQPHRRKTRQDSAAAVDGGDRPHGLVSRGTRTQSAARALGRRHAPDGVFFFYLVVGPAVAVNAAINWTDVDWLRANGVTGPFLLRAISRHPNILGVREEALSEVKEWYISQGVLPTKIPFMISVFPQAVSTNIHENLEPKRQFLMEQGLSQHQIVSVLQRSPQFMSLSIDRMEMKIKYLKKLGFSSDVITKVIANTPETLGLSIESIEAKLNVLTEILGTKEAAADAWSSRPRVIMYNSEQLKRAYKFIISVVGVPHERVVKNVGVLMRNVDRITRPRFEFLMDHQVMDRTDAAEKVFWILCSDHAFIERFPTYKGGSSGARREKSSEKRTKAL